MAKPFDIVIYGATSFVGKQVIRHFLDHYGVHQGVRWAIAGRNLKALEQVKIDLGPSAQSLPVLIADAFDLTALKTLCEQTKVVLTMAGPYVLYGENLVRACVDTGTDYADLTGEVPWVSDMIKRYEATAKQTGARIVNCCGFDSIPSDLGVHFLQKEALSRFAEPCKQVKLTVVKAMGNAPGGTYATMMDAVERATKSAEYRQQLFNPYLLCPVGQTQYSQPKALTPSYDNHIKQWTAFWVMAMINTKVVHRSNALSNNGYGADFEYQEKLATGKGIVGRIGAYGVSTVFTGFFTAAVLPPSRYLLSNYVIPKPSEGSNLKKLAKYGYEISVFGITATGKTLEVRVTGKGDPAVFSTSRMIAESGMTLAFDLDQDNKSGGFWTPATLLGDKLLTRLRQHAQMSFEVHQSGH